MTDEEILKAFQLCNTDTDCDTNGCPYNDMVEDCISMLNNDIISRFNELKAENAALRARLGKFDDLHIHMGEKVYIIADDNEIIERFICGVHILSTEIIFVTTTQKDYKPCNKKGIAAHITHAFENSFGLLPLRDFGERAFIHRESALVRLAELKGEEK